MKNKTNRLHFSTRTLAMVLSIVMLIGSIATGSMLSTFAAYLKDNVNSDAVSQAANEGGNIALNAIPSQDADTDAQADKTEDKPDLSGFEENEIVRGMKDDLAASGANVELAKTGFATNLWFNIQGDWDSWADHWVEPGTSYEIDLTNKTAGSEVEFAFKVIQNENGNDVDYWFKNDATIYTQNGKNYSFTANNYGNNNKFHVVNPCKIKVTPTWEGGGSSAKLTITSVTETTTEAQWYIEGGDYGNWVVSNTSYPLTQNDTDSDIYEKVINTSGYFRVHDGSKEYNCNDSSDTTLSTSWQNLTEGKGKALKLDNSGDYLLQIKNSTKQIKAVPISKSRLTIANVTDAVVTATYNGEMTTEGDSDGLADIPVGAEITISVKPDQYKKCTAVTATNGAAVTGAGNTWKVTMPASDTQVSATIVPVQYKSVYYNNNNSGYAMVSAYVKYSDGAEPIGTYPGSTMTKLSNSNIWVIEVPEDITSITFTGDNGYNTDTNGVMLTIPWSTYQPPMYTAGLDKTSPATNGTWGAYIARTNEITVSDGSTMSAKNLFTGISATLYDYYVDSEIPTDNANATAKWISDIKTDAPNEYGDTSMDYKWDPYTTFNGALSSYASYNSIQYPLYFGDLKVAPTDSLVANYHNFIRNVNNSGLLDPKSTAITGLSGKTLSGNNIHYYSSSDTSNENGATMAMFNEDFLSGVNSANKTLATILRTSSFPIRKENIGGTVKVNKIYLDPNIWDAPNDTERYAAYFFGGSASGDEWADMTFDDDSGYYVCEIPQNRANVILCRMNGSTTANNWNNKWNQTENLTIPTTTNVLYTISGWGDSNNDNKSTGNWSTDKAKIAYEYEGGYTYYEFDSTGGKDNAYIRNIQKNGSTAEIEYYNNEHKVKSNFGNYGFFPFDYNNIKDYTGDSKIAHDQGFGMKLEIPFTIEAGGLIDPNGGNTDANHQKFNFSGDDDLWVFIDNKLVLDLGGAHAASTGSIDFASEEVSVTSVQSADGSTAQRNTSFGSWFDNDNANQPHTMTIYYMERGMFDSNLKFGFSFHAIPNQLKTEKKVRTANINQGFYIINSTTGSDLYVDGGERQVTKFEKSYTNHESFVIDHRADHASIQGKKYTKGKTQYTVDSTSRYNLKNDDIAYFLGEFDKNVKMTLKEIPDASDYYRYDQSLVVYDDANNGQEVTTTYDATDGYTFMFAPTTLVSGGIENLNLRARFTNQMLSHDLSLTKIISESSDKTSEFTFKILFSFPDGTGTDTYIAYPLYCTVDGVGAQLADDGTITIKGGQTILLPKIPENAKVKITEELNGALTDYVYSGTTISGGATNTSQLDNGVQFTMGTSNVRAAVKNTKYKYSFQYQYPSYISEYGNQTYTASGYLTANDLSTYFNIANDYSISFKNPQAKTSFMSSKAPYENNFMDNLTLDLSDTQIEYVTDSYLIKTTASKPAVFKPDKTKLNVTLKLPYQVTSRTSGSYDLTPYASSADHVNFDSNQTAINLGTNFDFLDWLTVSGSGVAGGSQDPQFVTAPLVLYDSNDSAKAYKFLYWSVKSAGNSAKGYDQVEYTKCYSKEFNYVIFQDIVLEAVYSDAVTVEAAEAAERAYDPEARQLAGQDGVSITFVENSRNQYNNFGAGNVLKDKPTRNIAGDRMYSDFLLSFNNALGQNEILKNRTDGTVCGVIIQAVQDLTFTGSGYETDLSKYDKITSMSQESGLEYALKSFINSNDSSRKIGTNQIRSIKSQFAVSSLDNKNRVEYYYSIANKKDNTLAESANSKKLYRAFSYIKDGTTGNIYISDKPAYFTVYDMASIKVWGGNN